MHSEKGEIGRERTGERERERTFLMRGGNSDLSVSEEHGDTPWPLCKPPTHPPSLYVSQSPYISQAALQEFGGTIAKAPLDFPTPTPSPAHPWLP